ncbi:MaoC family dehydratase N-terminal domain-containing protein [Marivita sp. S0852]|uniref:FAS1-like dehydratase domain-containing protein n=1 Tax=Marivita sp. S0852 TaxID=3373893 RepID=UPI003982B880
MTTDYAAWIGKPRSTPGQITQQLAAMLHATLGTPKDEPPENGDIAPHLWHWAAFAPTVPMSDLADDGHQHRGDFLPPVPHPRRMWAGGELTFHAPLHIGAPLTQISTVTAIERKSSRMVFVTVAHEIYQSDIHALSERHTIAYVDIPPAYAPPVPKPVPATPVFTKSEPMPITRLFRYSAVTFNAHRIHYDLSYAKDVENYPGLVVHGPLQATLMLSHAVAYSQRSPGHFTYRGVHPMFHDDPMQVLGYDPTDTALSLCTAKPGSHQGMQATVTWASEKRPGP